MFLTHPAENRRTVRTKKQGGKNRLSVRPFSLLRAVFSAVLLLRFAAWREEIVERPEGRRTRENGMRKVAFA